MHKVHWAAAAAITLLLIPSKFAWSLAFHADLSPIHVTALPGDVVNASYTLGLAKTERKTHFKVRVEDVYKDEDGTPRFGGNLHLAHSCAAWVQVNPAEATVEPGDDLVVRLTLAVPTEAKPGGYWCVLTVDEMPDPNAILPGATSGVHMLASISTNIFIDIAPLDKQARILSVNFTKDQASIRIANTGNCYLDESGRIEFVKPGTDTVVATAKISRRFIFCEPINTALIKVDLPATHSLPSGRYLVRLIFDIGLDHYIGAQKEMDIDRGGDANNQGSGASSK